MPSAREDYLLRLIQQLAALARRLRERLTGAGGDEAADVEREAADAVTSLLGPQAALLHALDAGSAVRLAGGAERVATWITLLEVQADAARARGEGDRAERLAARAAALGQAARAHYGDAMPRRE
jgi:hypothetical protein